MEYTVDGQQIGYLDAGVVTYRPDDHQTREVLQVVVACMNQLGLIDSGFLVTLDGNLPNLIWGAGNATAGCDEAGYLRAVRLEIDARYGTLVLPHDTVLLYRGVALRLFGSDHPGSIVTTVPAR
jgi:hypothetical protein